MRKARDAGRKKALKPLAPGWGAECSSGWGCCAERARAQFDAVPGRWERMVCSDYHRAQSAMVATPAEYRIALAKAEPALPRQILGRKQLPWGPTSCEC